MTLQSAALSAKTVKTAKELDALPMFETKSYGTVESALIASYAIPDKACGAFRSRLGNLQKTGLFGVRNMPGKGRALAYGPDQFHRALFAVELLEFGIAPSQLLALVNARWESRLRKVFRDAENAAEHPQGPNDVILCVAGTMMTGEWTNALPAVNAFLLHKLADQMALLMKSDDPRGLPSRVIVTNLSQALRRFHSALASSYMDELRDERRKPKGKR